MKGERSLRRHPASAFPEITGVRLVPVGAVGVLLNLSATGVLIECASRVVPGTSLTVHFEGTFIPASVESRVVRCEVTGITSDGSLRFQLGLAFRTQISLACDAHDEPGQPAVLPALHPMAMAAAGPPVLRNRW
jgi:hypothetical protein